MLIKTEKGRQELRPGHRSLGQRERCDDGQTLRDGGYGQGDGGFKHFQDWLPPNQAHAKNDDHQTDGNFDKPTAERFQFSFQGRGSLLRSADEVGDFS